MTCNAAMQKMQFTLFTVTEVLVQTELHPFLELFPLLLKMQFELMKLPYIQTISLSKLVYFDSSSKSWIRSL